MKKPRKFVIKIGKKTPKESYLYHGTGRAASRADTPAPIFTNDYPSKFPTPFQQSFPGVQMEF